MSNYHSVGRRTAGAFGGLFNVGIGICWTIMAIIITWNEPFPWVRIIFPMFGVLFTIGGIAAIAASPANTDPANPMSVPTAHHTQARSDVTAAVGAKGDSLILCSKCGEPRRVGGRFCSRCGHAHEHGA